MVIYFQIFYVNLINFLAKPFLLLLFIVNIIIDVVMTEPIAFYMLKLNSGPVSLSSSPLFLIMCIPKRCKTSQTNIIGDFSHLLSVIHYRLYVSIQEMERISLTSQIESA